MALILTLQSVALTVAGKLAVSRFDWRREAAKEVQRISFTRGFIGPVLE
jgi:hypothetical protein